MADIMGVDPGDIANMSKTERLQQLTASLKGMKIPRSDLKNPLPLNNTSTTTKGNNQANVTEESKDESSDEDDDSDSNSSDDDSDTTNFAEDDDSYEIVAVESDSESIKSAYNAFQPVLGSGQEDSRTKSSTKS
eukprot:scaffold32599_cov27-Attheya_sp.AAC.1